MAAIELAPITLFRAVRRFALRAPSYVDVIMYFTKPDERFDLTLVSKRVYGSRDYAIVIQAAAGLDSPEQELTERQLKLPTLQALTDMIRAAGYPVSSGG